MNYFQLQYLALEALQQVVHGLGCNAVYKEGLHPTARDTARVTALGEAQVTAQVTA